MKGGNLEKHDSGLELPTAMIQFVTSMQMTLEMYSINCNWCKTNIVTWLFIHVKPGRWFVTFFQSHALAVS